MKSNYSISLAEWKILRLLWVKAPQSAYDLFQALHPAEKWHRNTINTLLKRLEEKGAVRTEKYKNLYLYHPAVSEQEFVETESDSFLQRVFGGAVDSLLVHFARKQKLTEKQIRELTRILERKER